METYTLYLPGREPRRRSAIPLMMAALAMAGGSYLGNGIPDWVKPPPREPDPFSPEELAKGRERAASAKARREKREARRQADRERTARQQGRTLEPNTQGLVTPSTGLSPEEGVNGPLGTISKPIQC